LTRMFPTRSGLPMAESQTTKVSLRGKEREQGGWVHRPKSSKTESTAMIDSLGSVGHGVAGLC
jgi:hypothetical protein